MNRKDVFDTDRFYPGIINNKFKFISENLPKVKFFTHNDNIFMINKKRNAFSETGYQYSYFI